MDVEQSRFTNEPCTIPPVMTCIGLGSAVPSKESCSIGVLDVVENRAMVTNNNETKTTVWSKVPHHRCSVSITDIEQMPNNSIMSSSLDQIANIVTKPTKKSNKREFWTVNPVSPSKRNQGNNATIIQGHASGGAYPDRIEVTVKITVDGKGEVAECKAKSSATRSFSLTDRVMDMIMGPQNKMRRYS